MRNTLWMAFFLCLSFALVGCKPAADESTPTETPEAEQGAETRVIESETQLANDPAVAAASAFQQAQLRGDDKQITAMLTLAAKAGIMAVVPEGLAPEASDTGTFLVTQVDYLTLDAAQVYLDLTDLDENRQPTTDQLLIMVRNTADGWRVAGLALEPLGKGTGFLRLNFEDPVQLEAELVNLQAMAERIRLEQQQAMAQSQQQMPGPMMQPSQPIAQQPAPINPVVGSPAPLGPGTQPAYQPQPMQPIAQPGNQLRQPTQQAQQPGASTLR